MLPQAVYNSVLALAFQLCRVSSNTDVTLRYFLGMCQALIMQEIYRMFAYPH